MLGANGALRPCVSLCTSASMIRLAPSSTDIDVATVHLLQSDRHSRAVANGGMVVHDPIVGNRVEMSHESASLSTFDLIQSGLGY
jgi:hypothetical protein